MSLNSGSNANVVKTSVDEVLFGAYDAPSIPGFATAETPSLFKQSGLDRAAAIELEYAGPGKWNTHAEEEDAEEANVLTGNSTTHNVSNWKQDLSIPKEFYDDDLHEVVNKSVADMGRQAKNTKDENAMGIYVDGFATHTTPDAAYVWSDAHTTLSGVTIDNLSSGAMTPATLETLIRMLVEQKDQRGRLGGHNPAALLVPPILFPDAQEFTKSDLKPNTTDNNLNYVSLIYPGLQVFQSPWVGGTYSSYTNANTAHYLVSTNHSIRRRVRAPLTTTLVDWVYDSKDRYKYRGRFREVCYAATWEGSVASTGA